MALAIPAKRFGTRLREIVQIRVAKLMALVALIAVLLAAWMYNREHANPQRSWVSTQIPSLTDADAIRRRQAAESLDQVEPEDFSRTAIALARATSDSDAPVRLAAVQSLRAVITRVGFNNADLFPEIDLGTAALVIACNDSNGEVRIAAIQAVGMVYDAHRFSSIYTPKATPIPESRTRPAANVLREAIDDPSPLVRRVAVWSFARFGPLCYDAGPVKKLIENDPDAKVRAAAVSAVAAGWPKDAELYPLLLGRFQATTDQEEHSAIGWALGNLAPPSVDALPALLDALSKDDWFARKTVVDAIGKLGGAARPALSVLAGFARDELKDIRFQHSAINAIIAIDPRSKEAQALSDHLVSLVGASRSTPPPFEAVELLAGFGPSPRAVNALRDALACQEEGVRQRASAVLGGFGSAASAAIPDLITRAREDPSTYVRRAATSALDRINASIPVTFTP